MASDTGELSPLDVVDVKVLMIAPVAASYSPIVLLLAFATYRWFSEIARPSGLLKLAGDTKLAINAPALASYKLTVSGFLPAR